jgi:hypothetical protein
VTPAEAVRSIETDRFAALVNLASDYRTFIRIASAQMETRILLGALAHAPEWEERMDARVRELASQPAEPGLEHPADAAVAVYPWLLGQRHRARTWAVVQTIAADDSWWWTRQVVRNGPSPSQPRAAAGASSA